MPLTFLWKQMRSPTAPRLVKFSEAAAALLRGCSMRVPTSDQVPDEDVGPVVAGGGDAGDG